MKARERWSGLVVLAVVAFVASGCDKDREEDDDPSCNSLCEQAQRCPNAEAGIDCRSECDQFLGLLRNAGCTGEYDDVLSCIDDEPDICTVDAYACQSENSALFDCLDDYCADHLQECNDALS